MKRRSFIKGSAVFGGAMAALGPFQVYVNQQGERGSLPGGPADARAVTYAIYGPF